MLKRSSDRVAVRKKLTSRTAELTGDTVFDTSVGHRGVLTGKLTVTPENQIMS